MSNFIKFPPLPLLAHVGPMAVWGLGLLLFPSVVLLRCISCSFFAYHAMKFRHEEFVTSSLRNSLHINPARASYIFRSNFRAAAIDAGLPVQGASASLPLETDVWLVSSTSTTSTLYSGSDTSSADQIPARVIGGCPSTPDRST